MHRGVEGELRKSRDATRFATDGPARASPLYVYDV